MPAAAETAVIVIMGLIWIVGGLMTLAHLASGEREPKQ